MKLGSPAVKNGSPECWASAIFNTWGYSHWWPANENAAGKIFNSVLLHFFQT